MQFGCSECLCIAIESHRPALLKLLLRRTDIFYRDIFWAEAPLELSRISLLHDIGGNTDLSFVGSADCGHLQIDVELWTPFNILLQPNIAFILVSLPMMARWHSCKGFNAERILRQSGKFDYSLPQFFHVLKDHTLPFERTFNLKCEFESQSMATSSFPNPELRAIFCQQHSSSFDGAITVFGYFDQNLTSLTKLYGSLSRIFFRELDISKSFCHKLNRFLYRGADPHQLLLRITAIWRDNIVEREVRPTDMLSRFTALCNFYGNYGAPIYLESSRIFASYIGCLFNNGLSYFNSQLPYLSFPHRSAIFPSPFQNLIITALERPVNLNVAKQLLALGYGRRELHPDLLYVHDEHLDEHPDDEEKSHENYSLWFVGQIRDSRDRRLRGIDQGAEEVMENVDSELNSIVDEFDSGPLKLQQLARIAIRRAVGGIYFKRRIRAIAPLLPPPLFKYVAKPNEFLLLY